MNRRSRLASEQGAILAFTAVAILVLVAFLTFVLDYGILWASRAQGTSSRACQGLREQVAASVESS